MKAYLLNPGNPGIPSITSVVLDEYEGFQASVNKHLGVESGQMLANVEYKGKCFVFVDEWCIDKHIAAGTPCPGGIQMKDRGCFFGKAVVVPRDGQVTKTWLANNVAFLQNRRQRVLTKLPKKFAM